MMVDRMSLISVDFNTLNAQVSRMLAIYEEFTDEISVIENAINSLYYSELDSVTDKLVIQVHELKKLTDHFEMNIGKLRNAMDLYDKCEDECLTIVKKNIGEFEAAASDKISKDEAQPVFTIKDIKFGSFENRLIINDDWLSQLIF